MNNAEVLIKFKGDTNDVDKKTSSLGSKFANIGKSIGNAMLKGTTIAMGGLTTLVGKSVVAAGEIEQQIGGTEAVFGEFAKSVQENADKAFKSAGISANDYMAYANKIGSLMKGSGIETEEAMNLSAQAMQRASDVASIMGIDVGSAMEAITGAAKGNFTMMDNLGVAMNATNLEAYALSKSIKKSYNSMTQAEKVGLAYEMFLEKTADYAGNYAKENETFAGSFNTLKAATSNFISGEGGIEDVIEAVEGFGKILINSITTLTPKVINGITTLVNSLIPKLPQIIQTMLPSLITGVISLTTGIINALPQMVQMITNAMPTIVPQLIAGIAGVINALAEQIPVLIPQIVEAILILIPSLLEHLPDFLNAGFEILVGIVKGVINAIPKLVEQAPNIVWGLINGIKNLLGNLWNIGVECINSIINGIKNAINKVVDVGRDIANGLKKGIEDGLKNLTSGVGNQVANIINKYKKEFGIHSPSKEFAIIGEYNMLGLEKGMQDMAGYVQKNINGMFDLSPSLYGNASTHFSPNVNVTNINNMEVDPLGQVVNNIKTFSNGSKNDYNYGQGV